MKVSKQATVRGYVYSMIEHYKVKDTEYGIQDLVTEVLRRARLRHSQVLKSYLIMAIAELMYGVDPNADFSSDAAKFFYDKIDHVILNMDTLERYERGKPLKLKVKQVSSKSYPAKVITTMCPECRGTGRVRDRMMYTECRVCQGQGSIQQAAPDYSEGGIVYSNTPLAEDWFALEVSHAKSRRKKYPVHNEEVRLKVSVPNKKRRVVLLLNKINQEEV